MNQVRLVVTITASDNSGAQRERRLVEQALEDSGYWYPQEYTVVVEESQETEG